MIQQPSLASAVVLPEPSSPSPSPPHQPQTGTKRTQQSSDPDPTTSPKRQRTHPPPAENGSSPPHSSRGAVRNNGDNPPSSHTARPVDETRDKRRNQRLFGALLGGLGGAAAPRAPRDSAAAKRRQEAEERRREEAMRREAELGARQQERLEKLKAERKIQQRSVEAMNLKIRHANLRACAGFLLTETEPRVYYEPWKLLAEEEEKIKQQKDEVEVLIDRELDDFADLKKKWREEEEGQDGQRGGGLDTTTEDETADAGPGDVEMEKGEEENGNEIDMDKTDGTADIKAPTAVDQPVGNAAQASAIPEKPTVRETSPTNKESLDHRHEEQDLDDAKSHQTFSSRHAETEGSEHRKQHQHHDDALHERERKSSIDETGDVIVEGEEDTVIY